ncbi:MAG TPA: hypothetical protein VN878_03330, partial [Usitatibacter sp.]|nr:hypothetical protein [Usitatibacter sp.]
MRLVSPSPEPRPRLAFADADLEHEAAPPITPVEGSPARLNDSERESLLLNLDVSLRVHTRPQLFSWVQGTLQSLIQHEVLVCASQEGRQTSLRVDSFTTAPMDASRLNDSFQQDVSLVPHLIKLWEENRCQAVLCDTARGPFASCSLARELSRLGVSAALAHGTHDATGNMASFFVFACRQGAIGAKQAYLADL